MTFIDSFFLTFFAQFSFHFFPVLPLKGLAFKGIVKGQESKVWAFFKGLRSFRGPQKHLAILSKISQKNRFSSQKS